RHAASRSALRTGGSWQKKLTLNGLSVWARIAASSLRIASGLSMAQGSEPRAPALHTATASALPWNPAMGAWMIGSSTPRSDFRLIVGPPAGRVDGLGLPTVMVGAREPVVRGLLARPAREGPLGAPTEKRAGSRGWSAPPGA